MKTGKARVVSKRSGGTPALPGETVISVDRTNRVLGNRHVMRNLDDPAERARVIAAHRADLEADLAASGPISKELHRLVVRAAMGENIALACWCAPCACHADSYAEIINARVAAMMREASFQ